MADDTLHPQADSQSLFGDADALSLHQLRLLQSMVTARRKRQSGDDDQAEPPKLVVIPDDWHLTAGVEPHPWQLKCTERWLKRKGRGTAKVVTGGGKTLLALMIAQAVQNSQDKELRVAVVVPTIVLMHQWFDALLQHSNLPMEAIGRLGGGYEDDFCSNRRFLISVLASASQRLPRLVKSAGVGDHLFLIADECHRAGAAEMSNIFKTKRRWSLGLSATPERDEEDADYNQSLLGKKLGPIVYEFTLADALREGLVPKFTINHYALSMTSDERQRYEALSRSISDSLSRLKAVRDSRSEGDFFAWARAMATRGDGGLRSLANRFISDTSQRRELLNHMRARPEAVVRLIQREFEVNPDARVILFHESIDEVMDLFVLLRQRGFPAIAEHSELAGTLREEGLDLFRKGIARIIVSARSLIEGFNVPAVDVGIIVASSGSVRQRIQSLGRVLRRHRGPDGEEKTSCIHVLYAANSTEENIYGKLDWDETTGVDRNRFYRWDLTGRPDPVDGPPKRPLPSEEQVDLASLQEGAAYPGQYEGLELTCDSQRNISNDEGQFATETAELADKIIKAKGSGGKFRVTPKRRLVLVRVPSDDDWETLFVTRLARPLRFSTPAADPSRVEDSRAWARAAEPGTLYPFADIPIVDRALRFKRKAGGVISRRVRGGEVFARCGESAELPGKGADASRLVEALKCLNKTGSAVTRLEVNDAGHVLYRQAGQLFFIAALDAGLEFPRVDPD